MKTWKVIRLITILTVCMFLLSSCTSTSISSSTNTSQDNFSQNSITTPTPTVEPPTVSTFKVINYAHPFSWVTQYILYDPETMVMYTAFYDNGVNEVGLAITPMYNADGTLRLYNPNEIFEK